MVIQYQEVSPKNTHKSKITKESQQAAFVYLFAYIYTNSNSGKVGRESERGRACGAHKDSLKERVM